MRLAELNLTRYGKFTDQSLILPQLAIAFATGNRTPQIGARGIGLHLGTFSRAVRGSTTCST